MTEPLWMQHARGLLGMAEVPGKKHNPEVVKLFAEAGHPEVVDDETSWCAAFAKAMLVRAGIAAPGVTLAARSFLKWGRAIDHPVPGCVVVFWRGKPDGWQGHVGFYAGETQTRIKVLGGNQSNTVSIAGYPKAQLLGYRMPLEAAEKPVQPAPPATGIPHSKPLDPPPVAPEGQGMGIMPFVLVGVVLVAVAAAYFVGAFT